jgi:hypothetical protein
MVHVDPNSKAGKVILVLGIPMFVAFLWFQGVAYCRSARSLRWTSVNGVVTEAKVKDVVTQHGRHEEAKIKYAYTVNGVRHENDTIAYGLFRGMLSWGHARRVAERYPGGTPVKVFYDPQRPGVSCLEPGGLGWEDVFMCIVSLGGVIMGTKQAATWLRRATSFPESQRFGLPRA